jgi:hypothetical protein
VVATITAIPADPPTTHNIGTLGGFVYDGTIMTSIGAPPGLVLVRALAAADDGNIAVRTNKGLALLRPRK